VPATHKRPEDPLGLAALYQNEHFGQFKNTLEAQKGELRPLEVKGSGEMLLHYSFDDLCS
jgi:hypothetical protein